MLKISGLAVAVLVGIVLVAAATRPNEFRVQRSASIKAASEKIFPHTNDLRAFNTWNPFNKKDPNIKGSYSGAASGTGSASEVRMSLHMLAPLEGRNMVEFSLKPEASQATRVTWAIHGPMPYISKVLSLFCDMDAMIGKEFENGLADLKSIVES